MKIRLGIQEDNEIKFLLEKICISKWDYIRWLIRAARITIEDISPDPFDEILCKCLIEKNI